MSDQYSVSPPAVDFTTDILWSGTQNALCISPRLGGRILSWHHQDSDELVLPVADLEGGLLRVIFAEERFPGSSYTTPHQVVSYQPTKNGFRIHLRYFWNTANAILRAFGWQEKINPLYLDGLLLDKTVTFDDAQSSLLVDMCVTNLSGQTKLFTPWLHNAFGDWVSSAFITCDGEAVPYKNKEIFWGSHTAEPGRNMRLVQANAASTLYMTLGADSSTLAGMATYLPSEIGQAVAELRCKPITLAAGECWHANAFLAISPDWHAWVAESPVPLFAGTQLAPATDWQPDSLLSLLQSWALPDEEKTGLLPLSFLDKVPFTALNRYACAQAFAGFHPHGKCARASMKLYALRDLPRLTASLSSTEGWALLDTNGNPVTRHAFSLCKGQLVDLVLQGPLDLANGRKVNVEVCNETGDRLLSAGVPADVVVTPEYPYQVKQFTTYLDERFRMTNQGFTGTTAGELSDWLQQLREKHWKWLRESTIGDCPLEPRLMERQTGPTCVRDKVLVQVEPGLWMPAYAIYPKNPPEKMGVLIFTPGSGPGKMNIAPDEDPASYRPPDDPINGMEYAYFPYRLATELNCMIYVPDHRGWGEQSESNLPQYPLRIQRSGVNYLALRIWDHIRHLDYLCSRPDVDVAKIGCFGASGGGLATLYTAGIDERVSAAIVSSSPEELPSLPEHFFYDMWAGKLTDGTVTPSNELPAASAYTCMLTIPRPLWIMDGLYDECVLEWHPDEDPIAIFAAWHERANTARAEIARMYGIAGVSDRFQASWFDYGHCGGMNFRNVSNWFRKWLRL